MGKIAFDLVECLRMGRRTAAIGNVELALLQATDPVPQHPRYRSYALIIVLFLIALALFLTGFGLSPVTAHLRDALELHALRGGTRELASALKAIHERPMQRWSIETLAGIAGMSRSSFCERFTTLVGRSPLRYHNEWRLTLARDLLAKRSARIGEIGLSIGYESEAAFSRAYKGLFGHSPRVEYKLRNDTAI